MVRGNGIGTSVWGYIMRLNSGRGNPHPTHKSAGRFDSAMSILEKRTITKHAHSVCVNPNSPQDVSLSLCFRPSPPPEKTQYRNRKSNLRFPSFSLAARSSRYRTRSCTLIASHTDALRRFRWRRYSRWTANVTSASAQIEMSTLLPRG